MRAPRVHPSSADATTLNAVFGGAIQIAPARKSMQRTSAAAAAAYRETRGQGGAIWKEEDSKGSRSKSSAIGLTVEQRRVVCQQSIDAISAAAIHHNIDIGIGTVNYVCDDDTVLGLYVKRFQQVEDSAATTIHKSRSAPSFVSASAADETPAPSMSRTDFRKELFPYGLETFAGAGPLRMDAIHDSIKQWRFKGNDWLQEGLTARQDTRLRDWPLPPASSHEFPFSPIPPTYDGDDDECGSFHSFDSPSGTCHEGHQLINSLLRCPSGDL